jgi:hypothetical protein
MTLPRHDGPVFVIGIADGAGDRLTDHLGTHPNVCRIPRSRLLVDLSTAVDRSQPALAAYGMPEQYWRKAVADFFNGLQLDHAARFHKTRWAAYTSSSMFSIDQLDRLFPTAQFVHVVTKPRGGAGRLISVNRRAGAGLLSGRYLEIVEDELITGLDSCSQRVLRFLGEDVVSVSEPAVVSVSDLDVVVDLADVRLRRSERP